MAMRVALFGGTGFVGSYLVEALIDAGVHPVLLVRRGHESRVDRPNECTLVTGDVNDPKAIASVLSDCDAAIYNIGILREFPSKGITYTTLQLNAVRQIVDAAKEASVSRFLLMSANGVKADGTPYQVTKYGAEQYLKASELDWTIFRPSVIFGDPKERMEFATQLANDIIRPPLPAPLFFDGIVPVNAGQFRLSPVHVEDVAQAFVKSLHSDNTIGKTYRLGGEDTLTWRQILATIADAIDKKKTMLPVPAFGVRLAAGVLDRFEAFPVTRDQINMLMEGNTCPSDDLKALDIRPQRFTSDSLSYLAAQSS
jgi:NADH dehydrogenase